VKNIAVTAITLAATPITHPAGTGDSTPFGRTKPRVTNAPHVPNGSLNISASGK